MVRSRFKQTFATVSIGLEVTYKALYTSTTSSVVSGHHQLLLLHGVLYISHHTFTTFLFSSPTTSTTTRSNNRKDRLVPYKEVSSTSSTSRTCVVYNHAVSTYNTLYIGGLIRLQPTIRGFVCAVYNLQALLRQNFYLPPTSTVTVCSVIGCRNW